MNLSFDPTYNLPMVINVAKQTFPKDVLVGQLCATQAIVESNLLASPSKLALNYNNLFGITRREGTHNPSTISLPSHEYIDGRMVSMNVVFSWNDSVEDSFKQYSEVILTLNRYKNLFQCKTFEDISATLQADGYATDPQYSITLNRIYHQYVNRYWYAN